MKPTSPTRTKHLSSLSLSLSLSLFPPSFSSSSPAPSFSLSVLLYFPRPFSAAIAGRLDEYSPYMRRKEENNGIFRTTSHANFSTHGFPTDFQTSVFKVLRPSVFRWQPKRSKFTYHSCHFQWIVSGKTTTSFIPWFPIHSVEDNPILNHDSLARHKKVENH